MMYHSKFKFSDRKQVLNSCHMVRFVNETLSGAYAQKPHTDV